MQGCFQNALHLLCQSRAFDSKDAVIFLMKSKRSQTPIPEDPVVNEHHIASDTLVGMDIEGTGTENLLGAPDRFFSALGVLAHLRNCVQINFTIMTRYDILLVWNTR